MQLDFIQKTILEELDTLEHNMGAYLDSKISLLNDLKNHIFKSGGKRLRPLVTLLSAHVCGYQKEQHIKLAAIIEFIHTATLLHDDVIDNSQLRRGQPSANALWGNAPPVLVGDFLYSRSFQLSTELNNLELMQLLAKTTTQLSEGETLQLSYRHNATLTETQYFEIIQSKTAALFKTACQLSALLSQAPEALEIALSQYGFHLGCAFQLMDDVLDYQSTNTKMGKHPGDDLAEGKVTLPLIHLFNHGNLKQIQLAKEALQQGDRSQLNAIIAAIESVGGFEYAVQCAKREAFSAIQALENVPDSPYKESAHKLAHFAITRGY